MADLLDQVHADSQGSGDLLDKVHSEGNYDSPTMSTIKHVGQGAGDVLTGLWNMVSGKEQRDEFESHVKNGDYGKAAIGVLEHALGGPGFEMIVKPAIEQAAKAVDYAKHGRYSEAAGHGLAAAIPVFGPAAANIADLATGEPEMPPQQQVETPHPGEPARAAGQVLTMAALEGLSKTVPEAISAKIPFAPKESLSPEQTSAVSMADKEGIPLPLGTRTGNKAAINLQGGVANAPGGASIARRALEDTHAAMDTTKNAILEQIHPEEATPESAGRSISQAVEERNSAIAQNGQETADAMAQKGQELADTVHPSPQTPETAADTTRGALESLKSDQSSRAGSAYDRLAAIEANPANTKTVELRREIAPDAKEKLDHFTNAAMGKDFDALTPQQQESALTAAKRLGIDANPRPVTQDLALPVDRRPVKAALKPILEDLKKQLPVAQQQSSRGLKAIENIVNGDDYTSASTAESDLSAVKAIQREAVNAKTKYLAGKAVTEFAPTVDKAVSAGGQDAIDALQEGRALTKAKYATQETIDKLNTEPVKLYRQLTAPGDTAINLLRDVKSKAPSAMPAMARATLQGLLEDAQNGKGIKAAVDGWGKLGDETKLELFGDPAKVKAIDDYMALRQRISESGSPGMESPVEGLPSEPVAIFKSLTKAKDAAIEALSTVTNAAPGSKPAMARAYVQDLLDNAGTQKALSSWKSLGDSTKQVLFPDPVLRQKVGDFFQLADMVGENPNKSGTAYVNAGQYILQHPVTGATYILGNNAMARLLFKPGGVELLTKGLKVNPRSPAAALAATQILNMAGSGAKAMDLPKAAQAEPQNDKTTVAVAQSPSAAVQ